MPLASSEPDWESAVAPPGSPFLDGDSITVAGAALLERWPAPEAMWHLSKSSRNAPSPRMAT